MRMLNLKLSLIIILIGFWIQCQSQKMDSFLLGNISFLSSQHVYVKFENTNTIKIGDTLFVKNEAQLNPALIVVNRSSVSCVCKRISDHVFKVTDVLVSKVAISEIKKPLKKILDTSIVKSENTIQDTKPATQNIIRSKLKKNYKGRISASSYSNLGGSYNSNTRLSYSFSFNADQISNSKFSVETYINFRHRINEWDVVKSNMYDALKIYSLSVSYALSPTTLISLGRKINSNASSIGVIDGIQAEKKLNKFLVGAWVGSRPDDSDYRLNPKLFQYGVYTGFSTDPAKDRNTQNTLAFVEQTNRGNTDRRFIYLQHTSTVFKDLYLFASGEMDLFRKVNEKPEMVAKMTNLYVSLRYRASRKLSFTTAYDARSNIIYYETYEPSLIDRLLHETETRQGLRFNVNYRPFKLINIGVSSSFRFQADQLNKVNNLNVYLNCNQIPGIKVSTSLTANFLKTNYLNTWQIGWRCSKDLFKGFLNLEFNLRRVEYRYAYIEKPITQNMLGFNFSTRLTRMTYLSLYYEGTFDAAESYHRLDSKIMWRF